MSKKLLLLLSGGIDSAVCLAMLRKQGFEVTALSVRQEARLNNLPEVLSARALAEQFGARHIEVDLTSVDKLLELVPDLRLSLGGQINNCPGTQSRGAPMGVSLMLDLALMHACASGIEEIAWALHADDLPTALSRTKVKRLVSLHLELAKLQAPTLDLKVAFPLLSYTKREIVEMAAEYGVDVAKTFSCSDPQGGEACGECGQCLARAEALGPNRQLRSA